MFVLGMAFFLDMLLPVDLPPCPHSLQFNSTHDQPTNQPTEQALKKYGHDLVADAEESKLDPVIGRDEEIRRVIQVRAPSNRNSEGLMGGCLAPGLLVGRPHFPLAYLSLPLPVPCAHPSLPPPPSPDPIHTTTTTTTHTHRCSPAGRRTTPC